MYISCSKASVCDQDAQLPKMETHRHTHIQPCTSLRYTFHAVRLLRAPKDAESPKKKIHKNTHIHSYPSLRCTFHVARPLCATKIHSYQSSEHTDTHTYTPVLTYIVHFLEKKLLWAPKSAQLQKQNIKILMLIRFNFIFCAPIETCIATNNNVLLVQVFYSPLLY